MERARGCGGKKESMREKERERERVRKVRQSWVAKPSCHRDNNLTLRNGWKRERMVERGW
tara:strand:- start:868 stop:1047 length:180 start_codon:yes stop_codon:yes gene_type:complete